MKVCKKYNNAQKTHISNLNIKIDERKHTVFVGIYLWQKRHFDCEFYIKMKSFTQVLNLEWDKNPTEKYNNRNNIVRNIIMDLSVILAFIQGNTINQIQSSNNYNKLQKNVIKLQQREFCASVIIYVQ